VSQKFLDDAQVGTAVQQVGRKCMAKLVRAERPGNPGALLGLAQNAADRPDGQATAAAVDEQGGRPASGQARPAVRQPTDQCRLGLPPERDDALPAAFAADPYEPLVEVEVSYIESHCLGRPKARAVQQFQERPGAQAQRVGGVQGE